MPEPPGSAYAGESPTANEQLVDSAIYHGLSLERVNADTAQKIGSLLTKAQEDITGKLASGQLTEWQTKRAQEFLQWSNKVIANTYDKIDTTVQDQLDGIKRAEIQKQTNAVNEAVGVEISPAMSTQQLQAIAKADELLVNGAVMGDWWQKQASNLQHNVMTTVQGGLVQGKSTQDIARDLRTAMGEESVTKAQAVTLARTAAATVQSDAQKAYYKQNDDLVKGIRWVSTLDSRTTPQCQALDGKTWKMTVDKHGNEDMEPIGHEIVWPGYPPVHWNCRSTTVPVLKSWQELAKIELPHLDHQTVEDAFKQKLKDQGFTDAEIANIEMNQRASVDGAVPEEVDYETWLRGKPESVQKSILGAAKWQLWADGKLSLADMVDPKTLEPLSVAELEAAAAKNVAVPPPTQMPEGMHGLSLAERQILTAQMTSEATSGETWASWFNPENGVTVNQSLKSSLTPTENAQLQAQNRLVHLTNTGDNNQYWTKSDAVLWAGQPGFESAKLVTPNGRVVTAKLKAGQKWTAANAQKFDMMLKEAKDEGIVSAFDQTQYANRATGSKLILTETMPGAVKLDSSTMKKVYGPVAAEEKPLSFVEAHQQQLELAKNAEVAKAQDAVQAQLKAADEAQAKAAEESQLARQKQADLQQKIAAHRLEVAEADAAEAAASTAKFEAEQLAQKQAADAAAARAQVAQEQWQAAQDELAAIEKSAEEAKAMQAELDAKIAKKQKLSEAAKKGAVTKAKKKVLDKYVAELDQLIANKDFVVANIKLGDLYGLMFNEPSQDVAKLYKDQFNAKLNELENAVKAEEAAQKAAAQKAADEAAWQKKLAGPIPFDDVTAFEDEVNALYDKIALATTPEEEAAAKAAFKEKEAKYTELFDAYEAQQKALAAAADAAAKQAAADAAAKAQADADWQAKLAGPITLSDLIAQDDEVSKWHDKIAAATTTDEYNAAKEGAKEETKKYHELADAYSKQQQAAQAPTQAPVAQTPAAPVNTLGQTQTPAVAKAPITTNFPADPLSLPVEKELGGYTHAQLVKDADGNLWVRKKGANPDHITSEVLFDHLYNIAGVDIPESKLYSTPSGPVKLARYVPDTKILGDYLNQASAQEKAHILGVVKDQFVANALFANWDAVGANPAAGFDNILIGKNGKAYMIDTGGAGQFKGTGTIMRTKFGPKVEELQTMLNPNINPTTAPIFRGITDQQVHDQIGQILNVRNDLLAASPEPVKSMLAKRIDYLEQYADDLVAQGKAVGVKPVAPGPVPKSEWAGQPDLEKDVAESKINGHSLLTDKGDVEDAETLVWQEKNLHGQVETVAQLKLRPDGMRDLQTLLQSSLPAQPSAYSTTVQTNALPSDTYYQSVLNGAKTVNTHINDGQFNASKISQALAQKNALFNLAATGSAEEKQMAHQYLAVIQQIDDNVNASLTGQPLKSIATFTQYQKPPPTTGASASAAPAALPFKASYQTLSYVEKDLTAGEAQQINGTAKSFSTAQAIVIDLGDVQARYVGSGSTQGSAYALQGQLEVRTAGVATPETMAKIEDAFKKLGIDTTPPSDDYRKSLYLSKNIFLVEGGKTMPAAVDAVMKDQTISDHDRLTKIEDIIKRDYPRKLNLSKMGDQWEGKLTASDDGHRVYDRMDITRQKIGQDMSDLMLTHESGQSAPQLVRNLLESGGKLTPTAERLRRGISLRKTGGMSPDMDLREGGASYAYVRIGEKSSATYGNKLLWDTEQLGRLDAYVYGSDQMGGVGETAGTRRTTIPDMRSVISRSTNETLFKNGLDLLEAKYVIARDASEKADVVKAFHDFGVTHMADGRKVEDAVVLSGQRLP